MLTESQQNFIRDSISHLIAFPTARHEFESAIRDLHSALISEMPPSNEEHAQLHKCLRHPEQAFLRLENMCPSESTATVGEVQIFLLQLMAEEIQKASQTAGASINDLWDEQKLFTSIIREEDQNKLFRSRAEVESLSWQTIRADDNATYSATLIPQWPNIYVHCEIHYSETEHHSGNVLINHVPDYNTLSDYEQAQILFTNQLYAIEFTEKMAADFTLEHLTQHNIVDFDFTLNLHNYEKRFIPYPLIPILTHKTFLSLLKTRKIAFDDIKDISPNQTKLLLNNSIIMLLQARTVDVKTILSMSQHTTKLLTIPYFSKLVMQDHSILLTILSLSDEQANLLMLPAMTNFLKSEKITLEQAIKLDVGVARLLSHPFYVDKIKHETVNWEAFAKINHHFCELLLKPEAIRFISNRSLPISDFFAYIPQLIDEITGRGMIPISDLPDTTARDAILTYYCYRLAAIYQKKPHTLSGQPDTADNILHDITLDPFAKTISIAYILEISIANLLKIISIDLVEQLNQELPLSIKNRYTTLNNLISEAINDNNPSLSLTYWRHCLYLLANKSEDLLNQYHYFNTNQQIQTGLSFFATHRVNQYDNELTDFCASLQAFKPLYADLLQEQATQAVAKCARR